MGDQSALVTIRVRLSLERFWVKVDKSGPIVRPELGPCWLWTGTVSDGYGQIQVNGTSVGAHRISWEIHFHPIPAGQSVLHRCDVRKCIRPDHLFLGTHDENMADMAAKGRAVAGNDWHASHQRNGQENRRAKIDASTATEIRAAHSSGAATQSQIAIRYGLSRSQVWNIVSGRRWTHV